MSRELIQKRIAQEFKDGEVVNLGFGMPAAAANYIPEGVNVILQTENGALSFGEAPVDGEHDPEYGNAGGLPITLLKGAAIFDLVTSFGIIRGGHVDTTILGALEVDEMGNIANWKIPGIRVPGMGGGMDLLVGAKKVVASLTHTDKKGNSKILKKCSLPLTAAGAVHRIITELAVFDVEEDGLVLIEHAPGVTVKELREKTEASFRVSDDLKEMLV